MAEKEYSFTRPPCPTEATTSGELYTMLSQFRAWVINEQEKLRPLLPPKSAAKLDDPVPISEQTAWDSFTSVYDKYLVATWLRRVRELWNHVSQEYERDWNCQKAIRQRFHSLEFSRLVLIDASIDPKVRKPRRENRTETVRGLNCMLAHTWMLLMPSGFQNMVKIKQSEKGFGDDWWDSNEIGKDINEDNDGV